QQQNHDQGGPPADAVAEAAEECCPDGAEEEGERERGIRPDQALEVGPAPGAEEVRRHDGGQEPIDAELVPLDEVADRTGHQGPARPWSHDRIPDVLNDGHERSFRDVRRSRNPAKRTYY